MPVKRGRDVSGDVAYAPRAMRRALLLALLLPWVGCAASNRRSEAREACFEVCAARKDDCMLKAMDAASVRRCDAEGANCSHSCRE